jgi:hypothetical protein
MALYTKKQKLSHIAEIEADPPSVGTAVFADLVPDDVRLVGESPGLHNLEGF